MTPIDHFAAQQCSPNTERGRREFIKMLFSRLGLDRYSHRNNRPDRPFGFDGGDDDDGYNRFDRYDREEKVERRKKREQGKQRLAEDEAAGRKKKNEESFPALI